MRLPKAIALRPEYECWPLWTNEPVDPFDYNVDPRLLGLSEALCAALDAWAEAFDATLNQDYPPDSAFPTPEARDAFLAQGEDLFAQLQSALPQIAWTFRRDVI